MNSIKELIQTADWKAEKHVPVIDAENVYQKGNNILITVSVGKQIPHPNTTEHHIAWIGVYFLPEGEKFAYQIGKFDFSSHGASTQGPNASTIYSEPNVSIGFKSDKSGVIIATSYCNIHGLWESSKAISVK